ILQGDVLPLSVVQLAQTLPEGIQEETGGWREHAHPAHAPQLLRIRSGERGEHAEGQGDDEPSSYQLNLTSLVAPLGPIIHWGMFVFAAKFESPSRLHHASRGLHNKGSEKRQLFVANCGDTSF